MKVQDKGIPVSGLVSNSMHDSQQLWQSQFYVPQRLYRLQRSWGLIYISWCIANGEWELTCDFSIDIHYLGAGLVASLCMRTKDICWINTSVFQHWWNFVVVKWIQAFSANLNHNVKWLKKQLITISEYFIVKSVLLLLVQSSCIDGEIAVFSCQVLLCNRL